MPNQLAKLRGKLEDCVEQAYAIGGSGGEGRAEHLPALGPGSGRASASVPAPAAVPGVSAGAGARQPGSASADGGPADDVTSPRALILHATFLAFQQCIADKCPA